MSTIAQTNPIAKLPVTELNTSLQACLKPVTELLPDARLGAIAELITRGIVTSQSPIVTQIAWGQPAGPSFLEQPVLQFSDLEQRHVSSGSSGRDSPSPGLLGRGRGDPVNFETPYTHTLEGVSTVMKSTPPSLSGENCLTPR